MRILCVAEKPSIAKSVAGILSSGNGMRNSAGRDKYCRNFEFTYRLPPSHAIGVPGFEADWVEVTMTSVRGHLMSHDFPERYKRWSSCNPQELFTAPIEIAVSTDAKQIAQNLTECARQTDLLMIWTDCDREGEHIGSEVVSICHKARGDLPVKRAKFSAIIANQIHRAMQHPVDLDWKAVQAVESRIELDLRLGAAFTRQQSLELQRHFGELQSKVVSYGPCQFPTLGFVVEQYCKVMEFVPEPFWYITLMKKRDSITVDFNWSRDHMSIEEDVTIIYNRCLTNPEATVTKVDTKPTHKWKPKPLTTVELQKAGGRLLKLAPKRVLDIAEKLYQRGLLSYPRTETDQYDPAFDFRSYIEKQKGHPDWGNFATGLNEEHSPSFERPKNGNKNDKAHPPIHPTKGAVDLSGDEKRVYDFITRRFLASCSKNAVGKETKVIIDVADEKFTRAGVVVVERNYLDVYPYDSWGGPPLPEFREGERFQPTTIEKKEGETSRPKLLTEADLVSLMDKSGIGTDATIAEHIDKIIKREYVVAQSEGQIKYLVPSTLGMGLVEGYNSIEQLQNEKSLCKPLLRRQTEERMGMICGGSSTKEETLATSLEEYLAVFQRVNMHMDKLISSMNRYLRGEGDATLSEGYGDGGAPSGPSRNNPPPLNNGAIDGTHRQPHATVIDLDDDDDDDFIAVDEALLRSPPIPADVVATERSPQYRQSRSLQAPRTITRSPTRPSATTDAVKCRCGDDASLRLVQKDGPNKGRNFWSCARPSSNGCGFFQWADEDPRPQTANPRERDSTTSSGDRRRCECNLEAKKLLTAKAGPNQGREFWICPSMSKVAQCKFFEWDDEEPRPRQGQQQGTLTSRGGQACFKCGATGHWSSACPNSANGGGMGGSASAGGSATCGGGDDRACFKCGQVGHWSSVCPDSVDGHGGRSGGGRRGGEGDGLGGGRGGSCYKCGESGHWASNCSNETVDDAGPSRSGSASGKRGRRGGGGRGSKRRRT